MRTSGGSSPSLPWQDPDPGARRAALARDRSTYRIARKYDDADFGGIAVAATVSSEDEFDWALLRRTLAVDFRLMVNQAIADFERGTGDASAGRSAGLMETLGLVRMVGNRHVMFRTPLKAVSRISRSFPSNIAGYKELFAWINQTDIIPRVTGPMDTWNRAFAWQRLAGANPMTLRRIRVVPPAATREAQAQMMTDAIAADPSLAWEILTGRAPQLATPPSDDELPGWFRITDEQYRAVMGRTDSFTRAASEGRLFLADYRDCAALPRAQWDTGLLDVARDRYLYPALGLFAWHPATSTDPGHLAPVAVQCEQVGIGTDVFTPDDGTRWKMACTVLQSADSNVQEMIHHLPRTHVVMEAAILAARRHLAPNHPLRILLEPHFRYTLAINDYATKHLVAPGGQVDQLLGSTLSGSLSMLTRSLRDFDFGVSTPDRDVASRGVESREGLPEYPWRDDALPVWEILHRFATHYVTLYYPDAAAIRRDDELQGFVRAFGDPDDGAIRGVAPVNDVADAAWFVGALMWTATCGHSALNYAQFDTGGFVPNAPGALYAPAPTHETPDIEARWMELLPPMHRALLQFNVLYQLSHVQVTRLGHYPSGWFADRRVRPLVRQLRRQLALAEKAIVDRDQSRFLPYPYLRPSHTGQSVFI